MSGTSVGSRQIEHHPTPDPVLTPVHAGSPLVCCLSHRHPLRGLPMKPVTATTLLVVIAAAAYAASTSEDSKVSVCVAKDRVLRLMDAGCAAGERRIDLRRWAPELSEA